MHFLGERVGEGSQGRLRGGVRRIPGNREEGEKGRREYEMPRLRGSAAPSAIVLAVGFSHAARVAWAM